MKLRTIALALALGFTSTSAMADPLEEGMVAFINGDNLTAFQMFQPLADEGNKDAQYHLGYMYQTGTGVDQRPAEALKWYHKAAEQGHSQANIQARVVALRMNN